MRSIARRPELAIDCIREPARDRVRALHPRFYRSDRVAYEPQNWSLVTIAQEVANLRGAEFDRLG